MKELKMKELKMKDSSYGQQHLRHIKVNDQ